MSLFSDRKKRHRRWQFRLSSLLIAMAICSLTVSLVFAILPRFIDDWKVVGGHVLIHLTPAAQEVLFDPPAPMGPMHETKVIGLRSLAYNIATVLTVILVIVWLTLRSRQHWRHRLTNEQSKLLQTETRGCGSTTICEPQSTDRPATSRIHASIAGGLAGALVGSIGFALMMRTLSAVSQTVMVGCIVGMITGTAMARRGIESTCVAAGLLTIVVIVLGTIALFS